MDWQSQIGSFLSSNTGGKIVDSILGTKAPKAPPVTSSPVITVQNPVSPGMSQTTMLMIGAGVLAAVVGLFFVFKK